MKNRIFLIIILICGGIFINAQEFHIAWIDADPDTIFADNNITYSDISVLVVDEEEQPAENVTVHFDSNLGGIIHNISTDEDGIAETTFWDSNDIGTALITAAIDYDLIEIEVEILPLTATLFDWITAEPDTIFADGNITYSNISVKVIDVDEQPAESVLVHFQTDLGSILHSIITDENGIAISNLFDSNDVGTAHVTAAIEYDEIGIEVEILPVNEVVSAIMIPQDFLLSPNPFRKEDRDWLKVSFSLKTEKNIKLELFNIKGQKLISLLDENLSAGDHDLIFDPSISGRKLSTGIYFLTLQNGKEIVSKKLVIY